jgi:hypothetical protein
MTILVVEFYAKASEPSAWPPFWSASFVGSLADAKLAARSTLNARTFPLAERFEISDENNGEVLYRWPEQNGC